MTATTETLAGYRNVIMVLRDVAGIIERNPGAPKPQVAIAPGKDGITAKLRIHCWGSAGIGPGTYEERKRASIEAQINEAVAAYGPDLAWVANDPSESSYDKDYFQLRATLQPGVDIEVLTFRSDIGEMVTTVESGPAVTQADGAVRAVRQTATMWKPNVNLTALATPVYELSAPVQLLELEVLDEADPF